jgi:hypothetical protein
MNKPVTLITSLIAILFMNSAAAQDNLAIAEAKATKKDTRIFNIISLDGKNKMVKITPEYAKRELRITCLKDTISIGDFWVATPEIHVFGKKFIEIRYEVKGGTNLAMGNTLVLCVNSNSLYQAMHVLRYANWDSGDLKKDYHIKPILSGDNQNNYKLHVSIHDDVNSKREPEKNYTYNNQTILSFDKRQHVFYSVKQDVYDCFIRTGPGKKAQQKVSGNFPMIILGKKNYYFINNRWYQSGDNNEMNEFE